jgi:hypothetical protein
VPDLRAGSPGLLLFGEIFFEDSRVTPSPGSPATTGSPRFDFARCPPFGFPIGTVSKVEP